MVVLFLRMRVRVLRVWEKKIEKNCSRRRRRRGIFSHRATDTQGERKEREREISLSNKNIMLLLFTAYQPTRPTLPFTGKKKKNENVYTRTSVYE